MVTVDRECYCNGAHVDFALHARGTFSHRCVPHTALSCTCTASTCTLALHAPHLLTPLCTTHGTLLHPYAPLAPSRTAFMCTLAPHVRHLLSSHTVVYHTRHFPAPARTAPPNITHHAAHPLTPHHPPPGCTPHAPHAMHLQISDHIPPAMIGHSTTTPPPPSLHDHFIFPSRHDTPAWFTPKLPTNQLNKRLDEMAVALARGPSPSQISHRKQTEIWTLLALQHRPGNGVNKPSKR
jgi:hypothetical protein